MLRRVRGATQTTEIDLPGAEDYVSHGRMNARKWIKTIGAPDMIAEQYDIAYAGGELPKDRYQRLALPIYADSGKKFDPCEMPKKWLKPLGPPLRKLYLCFFWNDICKVMYKDMLLGNEKIEKIGIKKRKRTRKRRRDGWASASRVARRVIRSTRARTGCAAGAAGMNECKTLQESTTNCVKSPGIRTVA